MRILLFPFQLWFAHLLAELISFRQCKDSSITPSPVALILWAKPPSTAHIMKEECLCLRVATPTPTPLFLNLFQVTSLNSNEMNHSEVSKIL